MILSLISIILIFMCLLVLMFFNGKNRQTQHWGICATLLLTISYLITIIFLHLIDRVAHFYIIGFPMGFLYGPTLFVLCRTVEGRAKINFWVHITPFLVFFVLYLLFVSDFSIQRNSFLNFVPLFNSGIVILHFIIYLIVIRPGLLITKMKVGIQLLPQAIIIFLLVALISLIIFAFSNFYNSIEFIWGGRLILISMFLITVCCVYSSTIYNQNTANRIIEGDNSLILGNINQYVPINLSSNTIQISSDLLIEYNKRVVEFINSLGYLDSELTKKKFSSVLGLPVRHVGHFLKQEYGESFKSFINQLRLNYAEDKLKDRDLEHTIEDLALICGFSSRASFYRNFQAIYGCSPHQYRNDRLIIS